MVHLYMESEHCEFSEADMVYGINQYSCLWQCNFFGNFSTKKQKQLSYIPNLLREREIDRGSTVLNFTYLYFLLFGSRL